jgi:phage terminase large subunit-like protein
VRAEPIAALYEQHRVHHVGVLADLEQQLTGWDASDTSPSPDRLDALVWALTELVKPCVPAAYGSLKSLRSAMPRRRM